MPAVVVCPECGATTTLEPDAPKSGTIPCRQCGIQLPVPEQKPGGPPPLPPLPKPAEAAVAAAPAPAPPAGGGFEIIEDDEDEDDRPRRRGRDDDDDDDEMDETGRPIVGGRGRSRYEDEDEDEDDDRLRSRKRYEDDEDDDDRPRSRSRDDDDEDDNRPRARRSRDDDDEDDGRPASRRSRDEDDEDRPARSRSRDDDDERPRRRVDDDDDEDERRPAARARDDDDEEDERYGRRSRDDDEDEDDRRRPAAADDDEDDIPVARRSRDEDDDEDDAPRARRAIDDEDDDEEPVARRSTRPDDDDDDEEIEEEEEEEAPKSRNGLLVVLLLLLLLMGAGGAAGVWYFVFREQENTTTVAQKPNDDDVRAQQGNADPNAGNAGGPVGKGPNVPVAKGGGPAWQPPARELAIRPVALTNDRKSVNLPGVVADACAGGDGRYLFLHCPEESRLLIFDVSSGQVVKELQDAGPNARFAAGATHLLYFNGVVQTIQRFDLRTLEKDREELLPVAGKIRDIALGSGSRGPALVVTDAPGDAWPVFFIDVDTLKPADVGWKEQPTGLPRDLRFRASANNTRFAAVPEGKDAKGVIVVARDGKSATASRMFADKVLGFASLSHDGTALYARGGSFLIKGPNSPRELGKEADGYTVASDTGLYDLHVRPGEQPETIQLSVGRKAAGAQPTVIDNIPQPTGADESGSPARFVHYVPDAHAAFVVTPARKKLEIVKCEPFAAGSKAAAITSTPPEWFTPGQPFEYPVRVLTNASDVKFAVSGPTDLKLEAGPDGTVRGTVPKDEKRDLLRLQVTVTADGARTSQTVALYNRAVPAPKTPEPKKGPEPKKEIPKSPETKGPVIAAGAKLAEPAKEKVSITPAEVAGGHQEIALPGQARDVCVGGGGRYLVFHVPTARKLVLFDASTLKVIKTLGVTTDELMFAAGMNKLVVVYPAEKTIVRYDLATLKPEADFPLETRQRPTFIAMGSGTAGPLILGGVPSQNNASKMALTFLEIESFKEVKIDKAEGDFQVTTATAANLRASADGKTLGLWRAQLVPSGVQIARLDGNTIKGSYRNDSAGEVAPGPDGQKVFTEQGVYDLDAKQVEPRTAVVPAVEGIGYVTLTGPATGKRSAAVYGSAADKPLATFDNLPGFDGMRDPFERDNPNLALDHKLFWVPSAGVLIVIPPAADKVHAYAVKK